MKINLLHLSILCCFGPALVMLACVIWAEMNPKITEQLYINDAGDVCTVYQVNGRAIGIECEKEASER